jgi:hypothetical protein
MRNEWVEEVLPVSRLDTSSDTCKMCRGGLDRISVIIGDYNNGSLVNLAS